MAGARPMRHPMHIRIAFLHLEHLISLLAPTAVTYKNYPADKLHIDLDQIGGHQAIGVCEKWSAKLKS